MKSFILGMLFLSSSLSLALPRYATDKDITIKFSSPEKKNDTYLTKWCRYDSSNDSCYQALRNYAELMRSKGVNNRIYTAKVSSLTNSIDSCNQALNEFAEELEKKGTILGKVESCSSRADVLCKAFACPPIEERAKTEGSVSFIYPE